MDPLSDALSLLKPRIHGAEGLDWGGRWSVQFGRHEGLKCYAVVTGQCLLIVDGIAEAVPTLDVQLGYIRRLYDDILSHYGVHVGLRHARKHLGWSLDAAADTGNAPDAALKRWKQTILTSEEPAAVHRQLDDAYDDFAWSAAA